VLAKFRQFLYVFYTHAYRLEASTIQAVGIIISSSLLETERDKMWVNNKCREQKLARNYRHNILHRHV
jgi:hypothetical protein